MIQFGLCENVFVFRVWYNGSLILCAEGAAGKNKELREDPAMLGVNLPGPNTV